MQSSRFCVHKQSLMDDKTQNDHFYKCNVISVLGHHRAALEQEDCNHSIISNYPNTFYDSLEINLGWEVVKHEQKMVKRVWRS